MYTSPAQLKKSHITIYLFIGGVVGVMVLVFIGWNIWSSSAKKPLASVALTSSSSTPEPTSLPTPSPSPSPTPSPTPKPLTFAEMSEKYGPCISLPILMYHHVQSEEQAKARGQAGLTVYTSIFKEQMEYLKDKGYSTITPQDLINFFDSGEKPPTKSVLITVDDGYDDNFTDMLPVLKNLNMKATVFLATGLMENPGYLNWSQIAEMSKSGIYFGNHTWSHKNMQAAADIIAKELSTAQSQLNDHGLDSQKVFAYPYGLKSVHSEEYLSKNNYSLAVDTLPGRIQCAKKRYELPRIRVGNTKLSSYGL